MNESLQSYLTLNKQQEVRLAEAIESNSKPAVLLFRILGPQLQRLFSNELDLTHVPRLLLHGNPHLDNYARTYNGAGLVDFDRSRVGPSLWDLTRALTSITFWSKEDQIIPDPKVISALFSSYEHALKDRLAYWETPDFLRQTRPKKFQFTPTHYLDGNKKWAKKVAQNLVDESEPFYINLFSAYTETLPYDLSQSWTLSEIAEVSGSMGKRHYVYRLDPRMTTREPILLDIKETYTEEDTELFTNPFTHQGERMVTASRLYSPGIEGGIGYCSLEGEEYWVRHIPTFSVKIPVGINQDQALQLAEAIGLQLGRGHRVIDEIYNDGALKDQLLSSARDHLGQLIELSTEMNQAVLDRFQLFKSSLSDT